MARLLVIMGPSGAGKTTLGTALAARLAWPFVDGDDFHTVTNQARMRAGQPLDESRRQRWLDSMANGLAGYAQRDQSLVLACSALRHSYRNQFRRLPFEVRFVYLAVDEASLLHRLRQRRGHFASESLLPSQLAALEIPAGEDDVWSLPGDQSVTALASQLIERFQSHWMDE